MSFLRSVEGRLALDIVVAPRSGKTQIVGVQGERLKIALKAPPVDGEANSELVSFLAKFFRIPRTGITIKLGKKGKKKGVELSGISLAQAHDAINKAL